MGLSQSTNGRENTRLKKVLRCLISFITALRDPVGVPAEVKVSERGAKGARNHRDRKHGGGIIIVTRGLRIFE